MAQTTTSTTSLPSYLEDPLKGALGGVDSWLKSDKNYVYGSKPGESLWTDLSGLQKDAIGNVDWLANQDIAKLFGITGAQNLWNQVGKAKANTVSGDFSGYTLDAGQFANPNTIDIGNLGTANLAALGSLGTANKISAKELKDANLIDVDRWGETPLLDSDKYALASLIGLDRYLERPDELSTERLVDENGWLGSIDSYMNPYIDRVLQPQIREIDEAAQRQLRDRGAAAAMTGSFGDARHGIADAEMYKGVNEAVSDATGRAYSDAFGQAMSARTGDITRKGTLDIENVRNVQEFLNRLADLEKSNQGSSDLAKGRVLTADTENVRSRNLAIQRMLDATLSNQDSMNLADQRTLDIKKTNQTARDNASKRELEVLLANQIASDNAADRTLEVRTSNQGSQDKAADRFLDANLENQRSINDGRQRTLDQKTFNAGQRDLALDRKATAARGMEDLGQTYLNSFSDINDMLFNAGKVERDAEEERRTAIESFQKALASKDYDAAIKMLAAISGSPDMTSKTEKTKSNDGALGLIGSVLGSLFG